MLPSPTPPTYPEATRIRAIVDEAENLYIDLTSRVVSDIEIKDGFSGTTPTDRVASIGRCKFTLADDDGLFSSVRVPRTEGYLLSEAGEYLLYQPPEDGGGRLLFDAPHNIDLQTYIQVDVLWQNIWHNMFTGRIEKIEYDGAPKWSPRNVEVSAVDFMDATSRHHLRRAPLMTNETIDGAVDELLDLMPSRPKNVQAQPGITNFPIVFDDIRRGTRASGEMSKLARSEPGFIYMRAEDTLIVENRNARLGTRQPDRVSYGAGYLLSEAGEYLLYQPPSSGGGRLLFDVAEAAFIADLKDDDVVLGENMYNSVQLRNYPRDVGGSREILYSLGQPVRLPTYSTIVFRGEFRDPVGGGKVGGYDPDTLTPTTDYLANAASDGSGTDITANISVVVEWYADGFEIAITTTSVGGWLTKLDPRAYAVRASEVAETNEQSDDSLGLWGERALLWDMNYRGSVVDEEAIATGLIAAESIPYTEVQRAEFLANASYRNMAMALRCGVGDLILLEREEKMTRHYIYNRAITIALIGIITVGFGLREDPQRVPVALQLHGVDVEQNTAFYRMETIPEQMTIGFEASIQALSVADNVPVPLITIRNGNNSHVSVLVYRQANGTFVLVVDIHAYDGDVGRWVVNAAIPADFPLFSVAVSVDFSHVDNPPQVFILTPDPRPLIQISWQTGNARPIVEPSLHMAGWRGALYPAEISGYIQGGVIISMLYPDIAEADNQTLVDNIVFGGPYLLDRTRDYFIGQRISDSYNPIEFVRGVGMENIPESAIMPLMVPLRTLTP